MNIFPRAADYSIGTISNFYEIHGDIQQIRLINSTTTPTRAINEEYFETKVMNILVNFIKIRNGPKGILRSLGKLIHVKNLKLKISCQTPYKGVQAWDIRLQGFYTNQTCMGR
jgi:hypothetical protein